MSELKGAAMNAVFDVNALETGVVLVEAEECDSAI